jgi:hypothetical protein
MANEPAAPGGATLYPDGGNNPAGNPTAAIDPATGAPKFTPGPVDTAAQAAAAALEPKPAEPAPAESAKAAEPAAKAPEEPPKKEGEAEPLDLKPYEGLKMSEAFAVDDATMTEFKTAAAEEGVSPKAAERLLGMYEQVLQKQIAPYAEAMQEYSTLTTANAAWVDEVGKMPEFQGEAGKRNQELLGKILDEFGGTPAEGQPSIRDHLNLTRAGNSPLLIRMILEMGKALVEGEPTPVGAPGSLAGPKPNGKAGPRTAGDVLYGNAN